MKFRFVEIDSRVVVPNYFRGGGDQRGDWLELKSQGLIHVLFIHACEYGIDMCMCLRVF